MIVLVVGGSGSGKSAHAEDIFTEICDREGITDRYYLATMKVYGEEGRKKVQRHRQLREGKGFKTIERTENISEAFSEIENSSAIMIECMSNLVANEMFTEKEMFSSEEVTDKILKDICRLAEKAKHLVIVSGNVDSDGVVYDDGTEEYISALGELNVKLSDMADEVYEVVVGIRLKVK